MQPNKQISRRSFLKKTTSAAVGAISFPYIVSSSALGQAGAVAAGERIVMGFIGTGGRGASLLRNFLHLYDAQVVAICDVKRQNRDRAKQTVDKQYKTTGCSAYSDFRELVARDDIDAVVVASTDHWHLLHALAAVRAGKDVYCEKPLGMSVEQGQVLRREVNRYSRVFQFGTQERSIRNSRFACEMVRSGRVGKIHKITVASRYSVASENYPEMPVRSRFWKNR
ncbi:MAG: Gfo/Idh/MocA family oxidoreductase [Planctomycetota bacterium]